MSEEETGLVNDDPYDLSMLREVLLDAGLLHSICLDAFNEQSHQREYLTDSVKLTEALSSVLTKCELDPLTQDEGEEIWTGQVNFAEFFLLSGEFLRSLHQTVKL